MYEVLIRTNFSGAHSLRAYKGECVNLHGHNWKVEVSVTAIELNKSGMIIDFKVLEKALEEIIGRFDHKNINEIKPFDQMNPTAENLARWVFDELLKQIPKKYNSTKVLRVSVWETDKYCASYSQDPS